jgi:hypothetical protein
MASLVKVCPRNPEPWSARGFAAGSWPALRHRSSEIEFALELQPGVSQAAVVGVPSRRWGEEVVAVIVPSQEENFDPERILIGVRKQLSPYKCPKRIVARDIPPLAPSPSPALCPRRSFSGGPASATTSSGLAAGVIGDRLGVHVNELVGFGQ